MTNKISIIKIVILIIVLIPAEVLNAAKVLGDGGGVLYLKDNGTLWSWGPIFPSQNQNRTKTQIIGANPWVSVSSGVGYGSGVQSDGTLWYWERENNDLIQIGSDSDWETVVSPRYHFDGHYIKSNYGENYTSQPNYAIKTDGTLWTWNARGIIRQVGNDSDWVTISSGETHTLGLKTDGTLWAWGYNWLGQMGVINTERSDIPVPIGTDNDWDKIAAGPLHSLAKKTDGSIWTWGYGVFVPDGDRSYDDVLSPVQIWSDTDWKDIAIHKHRHWDASSIALKDDGTFWRLSLNNKPVQIGEDTDWESFAITNNNRIAVKFDGTVWGGDLSVNLSTPHVSLLINQGENRTRDSNVSLKLSCSEGLLLFCTHVEVSNDGISWSDKAEFTQLIDWTLSEGTGEKEVFVRFTDELNNTQVVSDSIFFDDLPEVPTGGNSDVPFPVNVTGSFYDSTFVLMDDGSLWAMGNNENQQINSTDGKYINKFVQIAGDQNWKAVSNGMWYSLGIQKDGTLWTWAGEPIQIGNGSDWKSVVASKAGALQAKSSSYNLALKTDGTLWTWLQRKKKLILDDPPVLIQVGIHSDWDKIASGRFRHMGIKTDGTLWEWMADVYPSWKFEDLSPFPQKIGLDNDWKNIAVGDTNSRDSDGATFELGVKNNGTLWVRRFEGGAFIQVGTETSWIKVGAYNQAAWAIKGDNTIWLISRDRETTQVGADFDWVNVSSDGSELIGIKNDGSIWSGEGLIKNLSSPDVSIQINQNLPYTTKKSVNVVLNCSSSFYLCTHFEISNDNVNWSEKKPFRHTTSWNLSDGVGEKEVYVRFTDEYNQQFAVSNKIFFDNVPPVGTIVINNGDEYTNKLNISLALSCEDDSGCDFLSFSNDGNNWSNPESVASTKTWQLSEGIGSKEVFVEYVDHANNLDNYSVEIFFDDQPPVGSMTINHDEVSTADTKVTLSISCLDDAGCESMQFSDGTNNDWTELEPFSAIREYSLSEGLGDKSIYVQVVDKAGNSIIFTDQIQLTEADEGSSSGSSKASLNPGLIGIILLLSFLRICFRIGNRKRIFGS